MTSAEPTTIPRLLAAAVERDPDRVAVVFEGESVTYRDLAARVRTFGAGLIARGLEPGGRVAIWAPNSLQWIVAALGASSAGATLVPVNTRFRGNEAATVLRRSGATMLITLREFLGTDYLAMLDAAAGDTLDLAAVVMLDEPASVSLAAGVAEHGAEFDRRAEAVRPDDPADIVFTSGTTGVPKGVVQTHASTTQVARDWVAMTGIGPDDRYLMVNPYFHMFGLKAGILASIAARLTMYPMAVFDAAEAVDTIERAGITVFPGAPTLYQSLLDLPGIGERALGTLRIAVTGAADIPVALIERVMAELPFEVVLAGYGLSEGGTATATEPGDPPEAVPTTVGRPRPGFEVRIVDGNGDEVAAGDAGEIILRGPTIMSHYLDDPEATAATKTADGWLSTGDLGRLDEDGRLKIVGRSKDMFIVGGFNAYPAEIENLLGRCPGVGRVAVIGVPDERMGEVGMAFVVPAADSAGVDSAGADAPTPDGVIAWAREHMANYKVPRRVRIVDDLPLNATGKVEKLVLRELAGEPDPT